VAAGNRDHAQLQPSKDRTELKMLLKSLQEIGLRDLDELIGNVAEGLQVDFKQAAVGKADAERKEFVADVTAFANASGGDIVFGIAEGPDAVASQVLGIPVADLDVEERRLAEIIRNGTDPRLTDFEFKWIDNPPNGHVLILRVGRSWRAPHRVTLGRTRPLLHSEHNAASTQ